MARAMTGEDLGAEQRVGIELVVEANHAAHFRRDDDAVRIARVTRQNSASALIPDFRAKRELAKCIGRRSPQKR